MRGRPHADFAIKRQTYTVEHLKAINQSVNGLLKRRHKEALNRALGQFHISKQLTAKLHPEIRKVLKTNKETVHAFCGFVKKLHDYKTRKSNPLPSIPFSDEYLAETLLIEKKCDILLEETRKGSRHAEEARRNFILEMADLYERITGKKATSPFNNKGVYRGKFFTFISEAYAPINLMADQLDQNQPSTLAEAVKSALKVRAKATEN